MTAGTEPRAASRRLPILTYHDIGAGTSPLSVSPARFLDHVTSLQDEGWRCLSLDEMTAGLAGGAWPSQSVLLTFDDALASFAERALPVLARLGLPAILFAVSGRLGCRPDWSGWPASLACPLMDGGALREAAAAGIEIGAHSVTHRPLTSLGLSDTTQEILGSRSALEDVVGRPIRCFAYPFGHATASAVRVVREHFVAGFGVRMAFATPRSRPELLERIDAYYFRRWPRLAALARPSGRAYVAIRASGRHARRLVGAGY